MIDCHWLPQLELYNSTETRWCEYEDHLYSIFRNDFIDSFPIYNGSKVKIRYHPIENGKEESFYHVTCQDYLKSGKRVPDFRRCERIRWVRKFIENSVCGKECDNCSGIKVWDQEIHGKIRTHILLEEERYMVVIEKRPRYCLLITAFYFDKEHKLRKKLNSYYKHKP